MCCGCYREVLRREYEVLAAAFEAKFYMNTTTQRLLEGAEAGAVYAVCLDNKTIVAL